MEVLMCDMTTDGDGGSSLINQGKFAEAKIFYEKEMLKKMAKSGKDHPEYLRFMEKIAYLELLAGKLSEAKKMYEEILEKMEKMFGDCHSDCMRIYVALSFILMRLGKKAEADILYRKLRKILGCIDKNCDHFLSFGLYIAVSFRELSKLLEANSLLEELLGKQVVLFGKNHSACIFTKFEIGLTLFEAGKFSEAIKCYEEILKIKDLLKKDHISHVTYISCMIGISICYLNIGKISEAKIQLKELLRVHSEKFDNHHPLRIKILELRALCSMKEGNHMEIMNILEERQKNQVEMYGKESYFVFQTSILMVDVLLLMKNFTKAKYLLEELFEKVPVFFGRDNGLYLKVLKTNSLLNIAMEKYSEAAVILEELLLKQVDLVGKNHPDYLESKKLLADVYTDSNKFAEAVYIFEDVLRLQSSIIGADHEECLKTKMCIAQTYNKMKKFGKSVTLLEEVLRKLKKKLGEDNKDTVHAMGLLAVSMFGLGKKGKDVPVFEKFLRKIKFALGSSKIILNVALSLMEIGEYENCKKVLEILMKVATEAYGNDNPLKLVCQRMITVCLYKSGNLAEAEIMFEGLQL